MFKYSTISGPVAIAGLAVMLALGACSSGGDAPKTTDNGDMTMPDPAADQRTAIKTAIDTASSAVAAVNDEATDAQVMAADSAIAAARKAIMDAADVPAEEKAANTGTVDALASRLSAAKMARNDAMDEQKMADMKAMSAKAKALKKAIMGGGHVTATPMSIPAFDLDGDGEGTAQSAALTLKAGDAVGSLGKWMGMDYAGMAGAGDAKTTGMTRVYSMKDADKSVSFTDRTNPSGLTEPTSGSAYTGLPTAASRDIAGSSFPTTGTQTYAGDKRKFGGTYKNASGTYECTSTGDCSAAWSSSGITLAGTWTFTPAAGATVKIKDAQYLYFGWWVRKDKDGPTHAGALYGEMVGGGTAALVTGINNAALVGKATYMGNAAGKFAVSDPLRPANDNAGHFTADAELMADFKATGSTLSGTIDNFRLNDMSDDPGWSVMLQKAMFDGTDTFKTGDTPADDQTVWSIGGNKSTASGKWEAQMFDEKTADGSNVPTSVVGSFMSTISNTHEMVGAFGATKE